MAGALVATLVVVGCGGPGKLSAGEQSKVFKYESAFAMTTLDGSHYRETLDGVDYLIALCRSKGGARLDVDGDHRTVKQVVEDGANNLREYQPALAAKLDRVLDDGCG